jgi:hypothetical protein
MSLPGAAGLLGVVLMLCAYAGGAMGRLDQAGRPALTLNLLGAGLVLVSLVEHFNLAAAVLEDVWAAVALAGLIRSFLPAKARR